MSAHVGDPGEQPPLDDPLEQSLSLAAAEDAHTDQSRALQMPPQPLRALDADTLQSIQRAYPNLTELTLDNNGESTATAEALQMQSE